MGMDIGCHLPTQGPVATREALLTFCREAEAREIASLWVSDHVVFPRTETGEHPGGPFPFPSDMPYLEAVVALAAAATVTERAKLGASVFILGHRHPVVMAKMLSTIDVLSGGRLICGVGVGWWEEELSLLGVPYRQRGRQADEMIQVFKTLWTEEHPRFEGRFYTIPDVGFAPKPLQKPHPPIVVGGDSPGAFKRTVELADGWHATAATPEQAAAALERLRAAADAGRAAVRVDLAVDPLQREGRAGLGQVAAAGDRRSALQRTRRSGSARCCWTSGATRWTRCWTTWTRWRRRSGRPSTGPDRIAAPPGLRAGAGCGRRCGGGRAGSSGSREAGRGRRPMNPSATARKTDERSPPSQWIAIQPPPTEITSRATPASSDQTTRPVPCEAK